MHNLIIAALQKGGIHGAKWLHATRGQGSCKSHPVLLGNPHVKTSAGIAFGKKIKPRAIRHGGRHCADFWILLRLLKQRLSKNRCIGRCIGDGFGLCAGHHVKFSDPMTFITRSFRRAVPLTLLGDDMDQHRTGCAVAHHAQHRQQLLKIMPINGAKIAKAQLLKHRAANGHMFQHLPRTLCPFLKWTRQKRHRPFGCGLKLLEGRAGVELAEIGRQGTHRRGNRHFIVIENDNHAFFQIARIVHRLKGHAGTHGPVTNHGNGITNPMFGRTTQITRHSKAECRRNGG